MRVPAMSAGHPDTGLPSSKSPKVSKPKRSKSEVVGVTLDATALLLTTLREVARVAPLPLVQNAATLALTILSTVQGARDNKGAFRRLADDAGNLVCAVARKTNTSLDMPSDLYSNLESLITTLSEIKEFASRQLQRNIVLRLVQSMSDLRVIQQYRETLRQSLDVFGLKASITLQENMATLLAQQEEILKGFKEHRPDSGNLIGSQDPSAVVPHIESSDGTFEFTTIEGNQTRVDSSQHINNSNSNNTTTTKTESSGNDRSMRLVSDGRDGEVVSMATELRQSIRPGLGGEVDHGREQKDSGNNRSMRLASDGRDDEVVSMATELRQSIRPGLGGEFDHGREQKVKDSMVKRESQARPNEGVQSSYMAWATERDGSAKLANEVYQAREGREGGQGTVAANELGANLKMDGYARMPNVDVYARGANVMLGAPASLQNENREQGRREQKIVAADGVEAQHISPDHAMAWAVKVDDSGGIANEGVGFPPPLQYLEREQRGGGQRILPRNGLEALQVLAGHPDESVRMANGNIGAPPISQYHEREDSEEGRRTVAANGLGTQHSSPGHTQGFSQRPFMHEPSVAAIPEAPQMMSSSTLGVPLQRSNNPFHQTLPYSGGAQLHSDSALHGTNDGLLGNPALQPNSRAISMPNPLQRYFPNINSQSGRFNFTQIRGDQNILDSSSHVTNSNSGNNTTTITTDSHNDLSVRLERSAHSLPAMQNVLPGMPSEREKLYAYDKVTGKYANMPI